MDAKTFDRPGLFAMNKVLRYISFGGEEKGKVPEIYVIGDAVKARKALKAIEEAARVAVWVLFIRRLRI